jgi:hypothetical protein
MADDFRDFRPSDDLRDERIARRRTRRTAVAVSDLCSSWMRAGADVVVGGLNIAGQVAEELSDGYCDRGRRSD